GVYNSYTQANIKPYQNYLYHDLSWYVQDTWKATPRLTFDLGVRFSWYQPVYNSAGDASYFAPDAFGAAQGQRRGRPVCVGAATWAARSAACRAIDPAVSAAPIMANPQPGFYVGKLVPNSGNFTNGLVLASAGYPKGGIDTRKILTQPRLGFAWD